MRTCKLRGCGKKLPEGLHGLCLYCSDECHDEVKRQVRKKKNDEKYRLKSQEVRYCEQCREILTWPIPRGGCSPTRYCRVCIKIRDDLSRAEYEKKYPDRVKQSKREWKWRNRKSVICRLKGCRNEVPFQAGAKNRSSRYCSDEHAKEGRQKYCKELRHRTYIAPLKDGILFCLMTDESRSLFRSELHSAIERYYSIGSARHYNMSLSAAIKELDADGYIVREILREDNRRSIIDLTRKGVRRVASLPNKRRIEKQERSDRRKKPRFCLFCTREILFPSGTQKYCSLFCGNRFHSHKRGGRKIPVVDRECKLEGCKTMIDKYETGNRKYCSHTCWDRGYERDKNSKKTSSVIIKSIS